MMNLLKKKELPYLITLLFVLAGWSLTHIVSRLVQSPMLEYQVKTDPSNPGVVSYTITNVSSDRLYKNLTFLLRMAEGSHGKILSAELVLPPPVRIAGSERKRPEQEHEYVTFEMPELHPGWRIILELRFEGTNVPQLRFSSADDNPIRLVAASFETFLIKNELRIITALLGLWVGLILIYIFFAPLDKNTIPSSVPLKNVIPMVTKADNSEPTADSDKPKPDAGGNP